MYTSASIGLLNDVTIMIPAASATASPMAFWAFRMNSGASWRSAASIAQYRDPPGISGMTVGIKIVVAGVFRTLAQISE